MRKNEMSIAPRERIRTEVFADDRQAGRYVAGLIAAEIRRAEAAGRHCVLGLATGSTPISVYRELIRLHKEGDSAGRLSFRNCYAFNLDEYYPMASDSLHSYRRWMHENLFEHIDLPADRRFIPDGMLARDRIDEHCRRYEERIRSLGGVDFQLLGIGRTGHIGFNEPGSPRDSRTRMVDLDGVTRKDAAAGFFGEENVPRQALTMGVGTIMEARRIVIMAFGEHKAPIVRRAIEEPPHPDVTASHLQAHLDTVFVTDAAAAAHLARVRTPWLSRTLEWTPEEQKQAVIHLSLSTGKGILKLSAEDYSENGLHDLLHRRGPSEEINRRVFRELLSKITDCPGGATGGKRALCFSPHPDDDVISMGGTLIKLTQHRHDVHIAYQTSGNIAVFDHAVKRLMDFYGEVSRGFEVDTDATRGLREKVAASLAAKVPGEPDGEEVQRIKTIIRRTEARAGAIHCGVPSENLHFLDMPFYKTGKVAKKPLTEADFETVAAVIKKVKPDIILLAGDLSDPHGTHRQCADAIYEVLRRTPDWHKRMEVLLYRGAWQEWEPEAVDLLVPLSAEELMRKRHAVFRHESQKDTAMFPGSDAREFWQRAEDRNKNTAATFDKLGLPEYYAMEGFVRLTPAMLG
jgi:glucosamine-6-phosphate deaminase